MKQSGIQSKQDRLMDGVFTVEMKQDVEAVQAKGVQLGNTISSSFQSFPVVQ